MAPNLDLLVDAASQNWLCLPYCNSLEKPLKKKETIYWFNQADCCFCVISFCLFGVVSPISVGPIKAAFLNHKIKKYVPASQVKIAITKNST